MYQVIVNNGLKFAVETNKSELKVNGATIVVDKVDINKNSTHLLFQNKSYTVELVQINTPEKTAMVKVNGNLYAVQIQDQFDQLLKQLGMDNLAASKILQVKAPMPGLVLNILVAEGAEIKKGDNLLVLEAMKMENMIKSPSDGIIKRVAVAKGNKVEKNELLISFK